jgi:SAM-dependent methyltransferase
MGKSQMRRWWSYLTGRITSFEDWQRSNPTKSFRDFFTETVEPRLRRGESHPSLGQNLQQGTYGSKGKVFFEKLKRYGLTRDSVCVDYGCGTLRLGLHVINYISRGCYWGMDISEFLLEQGRGLVGEKLWSEKEPRLRVISSQSVAEVAACSPDMLFSVKVLIHIHPKELENYFQNLIKIVNSGQAIIAGKWSEHETVQISELSWGHSADGMQRLISSLGGRMTWLERGEPLSGSIARGIFRVTPASALEGKVPDFHRSQS